MGVVGVATLVASLVAGILLGLRFKVLILIPAAFLVAIAAIAVDDQSTAITALTLFAALALLQSGYLAGCTVHKHLPWRRRSHDRLFKFNRAL